MSGHRSHQSGRDVDLLYYALDEQGRPFRPDEHMAVYRDDGRATYSRPWRKRNPIPTRYFDVAIHEGVALRVRMSDGKAVEGRVRENDREMLTLEVEGGGPVMIRKSEIRYVEELGA